MKVSTRGILEIAEHEGIVPAPYYDSVGVLTYGIGHTKNAGGPDPAKMSLAMPADIDKEIDKALKLFAQDVVKYEKRVNSAVKVPLAQHEFDALVSFDLNTGGIHRAKLTKAINAHDPDAKRHFMGWLRPPELRKRRTAEMDLFHTGDYDANGDRIPVWKTNGKGKLIGQLRTMSGDEVLKRMGRTPASGQVRPLPTATVHWLVALLKSLLQLLFGGKK